MISGVGPHLPPYLRHGLLLFTTGYTRLAIYERFSSLHLSSNQRITELQMLVLPCSDEVGSGDPISGLHTFASSLSELSPQALDQLLCATSPLYDTKDVLTHYLLT